VNALPPKFLAFLRKYNSSDLSHVIDMMITPPLAEDVDQLAHDGNVALLNAKDAKASISIPRPKSVNKTKQTKDHMPLSTRPHSLRKICELLDAYPDLKNTVLEASRRGCPIAKASFDLIAMLASDDKRIRRQQNHHILTVEDLLSAFPGNQVTTTTMYRAIELTTLEHDRAMVLPPSMLQAWTEDRTNKPLRQYLIQMFLPDPGLDLPRTIYILPQREVV
jgi:hypothetical protein